MSANLFESATADLQQHPLSAAFPAMPDEEFQALKDSIESIGVQNPIVLFEGMVLDGWHRYRAAQETLSSCPAVDLADDVDPKDFVVAQNERRRHLTKSQIADAIVRVFDWQSTGRPKVEPSSTFEKTNSELANIAGVSTKTIQQAKFVQTQATPEVQDAVKAGTVSLKDAAAVANLPANEQAAIAAAGRRPSRRQPGRLRRPKPMQPPLSLLATTATRLQNCAANSPRKMSRLIVWPPSSKKPPPTTSSWARPLTLTTDWQLRPLKFSA